ncbi:MAG: ISLre2 family transposase [Oscillospiraceae bacterium]|nr:ISLre2 family transposase [Oscillospiraceae bacterium]
MMIVAENSVDFNSLEQEICRKCYELGRMALKAQLEKWDRELMADRDRTVYRHKGQKKTVIKTVMGEVEYQRAIYERKNEDGTKSFVYLLDEALGISGIGFMSGLLSAQIAEAACAGTYRRTAQSVSEMTGQTISHTAAWNVVQKLGNRIDEQEQVSAKLAAVNKGIGKLESKVLFEEQDGIWLHLQGKSREEYGRAKEMKVAIAYDGSEKIGESRYKLTNKVAAANFESINEFVRRKEGKIAETYCVDEVETRILNGDGASWIKKSLTDETVIFQLDTFHRNKAIRENVSDPVMAKEIFRLLYSKKTEELLVYIEALSNSVEDEKKRERLTTLHTYFTANKDGLIGWQRRGLDLPKPPEGKKYRRLGTMESNIFTIIGNRMKDGRAYWSVNGGNNLARLLTLKHTSKLSDTLNQLTNCFLPQKYAEEVIVKMSASRAPKQDGRGFEPVRAGAVPATPGYKFLRGIGKIKNTLS